MISDCSRIILAVWIGLMSMAAAADERAPLLSHEINVNALYASAGFMDVGYQYSINRYVGFRLRALRGAARIEDSTYRGTDEINAGILVSLPTRPNQSVYLSAEGTSYEETYEFDNGRADETYSGKGSSIGLGYRWVLTGDPMAVSVEYGRVNVERHEVILASGKTDTTGSEKFLGVRLGFVW
ncbi:MAG: porin family protein [Gammaproteobacteria bacterium]|nr:porin family protein [Gammaproteobacteria bacterium]